MRMLTILAVLTVATLLHGAENITPSQPKDWSFGGGLKLTAQDGNIIAVGGTGLFLSQKSLTIDPAAHYRIAGSFRSGGSANIRFYFGATCLDAQRKPILPSQFLAVPGSDTVLTADCLPTDWQLSVKDASRWKSGKLYKVAFETDPSGKFADLPNDKLAVAAVTEVSKEDGKYTVKLENASGKFYPAGTHVRQHQDGPNHLYVAAWKEATPQWQEFSAEISGMSLEKLSTTQWRPGTKLARLCIIANSTGLPDAILEMRDISLTRIDD